MKQLVLICILALFASSCQKQVETIDINSEYQINQWYPVDKDFYREYKLDSTQYLTKSATDITIITNSTSYDRELLGDIISIFDTPNQVALVSYTKKEINQPWSFQKNLFVQLNSNSFFRIEDNLRFQKLFFPMIGNQSWKGNQYIDTGLTSIYLDWNYTYRDINKPKTINGFSFDSTVTVIHIDDENSIEKKYSTEIYAKHVGLIYSEFSILYKQDGLKPWSKPENGYTVKKVITDWKK